MFVRPPAHVTLPQLRPLQPTQRRQRRLKQLPKPPQRQRRLRRDRRRLGSPRKPDSTALLLVLAPITQQAASLTLTEPTGWLYQPSPNPVPPSLSKFIGGRRETGSSRRPCRSQQTKGRASSPRPLPIKRLSLRRL